MAELPEKGSCHSAVLSTTGPHVDTPGVRTASSRQEARVGLPGTWHDPTPSMIKLI